MAKRKMKKPPNKKGVAGVKTGATARSLIRQKQKGGCTIAKIAMTINRSPGTTSAIASGEIKNPPKQVIDNLRKLTCKKKKKR